MTPHLYRHQDGRVSCVGPWYWRLVWGWLVVLPTQGEMLPRGFGVAWCDPWTDTAVAMPLGLNVLAGAVRRAWHALKHGVGSSELDVLRLEVELQRLATRPDLGARRPWPPGSGEHVHVPGVHD